MYVYIPIEENLKNAYIGEYKSYGIKCVKITEPDLGRFPEQKFISDISTNAELVSNLAAKCTAGQVSPIHILDVIEDEL